MRIRRGGCGCLPWIAVAVVIGFIDWHPWLLAVAAVLVVAAVAYVAASRRGGKVRQ